ELHLLRQRQSREPEVHRQGDPRRSHHLPRRRHHGEALHHHRARPEDAAADQPPVDADQDWEVVALFELAERLQRRGADRTIIERMIVGGRGIYPAAVAVAKLCGSPDWKRDGGKEWALSMEKSPSSPAER